MKIKINIVHHGENLRITIGKGPGWNQDRIDIEHPKFWIRNPLRWRVNKELRGSYAREHFDTNTTTMIYDYMWQFGPMVGYMYKERELA